MAYSVDEMRLGQAVFAYLLEHRELAFDADKDLYRSYTDSDVVQYLVQSQAALCRASVARYEDVIYLIPADDNYCLGFSKSELKRLFCRSAGSESEYCLALFAILVLLDTFYCGIGADPKVRSHLRMGDLQNAIAEYLQRGTKQYTEEEQNEQGLLFTEMAQMYESLKSDEKLSRKKSTKEGFVYGILRFLQDQGLVNYIEADEMITTTKKLDHFMQWHLLDKANYERVMHCLETLKRDTE